MNSITTDEGFKLIKRLIMIGKNIGFTKHRKAKETIFVFSKGDVNINSLNNFFKEINKCNKKLKIKTRKRTRRTKKRKSRG